MKNPQSPQVRHSAARSVQQGRRIPRSTRRSRVRERAARASPRARVKPLLRVTPQFRANSMRSKHAVLLFDAFEVDARKLPQPEEHLFLERLGSSSPRRSCRQAGAPPRWPPHRRPHRARLPSAYWPSNECAPGAEAQIRLPPPIFQIVPRGHTRQSPIRDFVVLVAGCGKLRARPARSRPPCVIVGMAAAP